MPLILGLSVPAFNVIKFIVLYYVWGTVGEEFLQSITDKILHWKINSGQGVEVEPAYSIRNRRLFLNNGRLLSTVTFGILALITVTDFALEFAADATPAPRLGKCTLRFLSNIVTNDTGPYSPYYIDGTARKLL